MRFVLLFTLVMSAIRIPAQEKVFQPEGTDANIHYSEYGNGEAVLLMIHGLGSNSRAFDKLIPLTSESFKTVVVDLPGYRKSVKGELDPGMKNYAQILTEFIHKNKYTNVTLVGHSMGGQIALTMAQLPGEKPWLKGLFLLAPAGIETFSESDRNWFAQYVTPQTMAMLPKEQIKKNFDVNFAAGKTPEDAGFMFEERLALMEDPENYRDYLETVGSNVKAMLEEPVIEGITAINKPVWIVYGEQDYLIPNRILHPGLSLKDLEANCDFAHSESRFMTIENAGHFLVWDQPERIAQLIIDFLNNV